MRRSILPLLPATLLVLFTLPAGSFGAEAPRHVVPEARPIQLDGHPAKAEWSDALALDLDASTQIRLQQYRGTLLLGFKSDRYWTAGSILTLFFCPNGPKAGGRGPGCLRIDYEPFRHDRAHAIAYRYDDAGRTSRLHAQVVVRHRIGDHGTELELACPILQLGITKPQKVPLRFCVQWARRGSTALTYPTNLDLRGAGRQVPVDFASAGRWALLEGWGDPKGFGAFPKAQWSAWTKHDAEITRRGKTAHARISELTEEWRKETKDDTKMLAEVTANFAWIREHEPLTPSDLLATATLWRYLNQYDRAASMLTALIDASRRPTIRQRAIHQRAIVNHARERYDEEAADWTHLAAVSGVHGGRYKLAAEGATRAKGGWDKEQAARRAVEANAAMPRVRLDTVRGPITVILHADVTPEATKHFVALVKSKLYDGTLFHRVKGNYMAQGGDPKSRELGCEFAGEGGSPSEIEMEINPRHEFYRGALCFARAGHKETNGSQFFIMTAPEPGLGAYTIFGHVVSGMAAVDRIQHCDALTRAVALQK